MLNLKELNANQLKAVTVSNGPTIVVAGAGTGKTKVLTTRIAYLIEHEHYKPSSILAITFTNKAANEMKYRINKLVGIKSLSWIGTYHSICLRILKEDIDKLNRRNDFGVIDDEDQMSLIREIYRVNQITENICSTIKFKKALQLIETIKFQKININDFNIGTNFLKQLQMYSVDEYKAIKIIFNEYQRKLLLNNLLDFNDLLIYTEQLLSKKEIQIKWQSRFKYILVDEFQDTNEIQFNILKMLIDPLDNNVFVVGDPDQSIYKWRGAYEWIFKDFRETYPKAKLIILDTNYRSTKNILLGSNALIQNNYGRIEKSLITENNIGEKIQYFYADSQSDEGLFVAEKIIDLIKQGYKYSDIGILYRSNYLSRFCEDHLMTNSIPYKIFGGVKFYQRKEIKDLLAYLKVMVGEDELSLKRIINVPTRGIGERTVQKIEEYSLKNNISFFECLNLKENVDWNTKLTNNFYEEIINLRKIIKDLTPSKSLIKIIEKISYREYLKTLDLEEKNENIDELINAITIFESEHENANIQSYLQEISLYTDTSEQKINNDNSVSLMTVHVAKGSEYKVIFLIGFSNGIFPPAKSTDFQEERRIAYVALTRAKQLLFITCSDGYSYSGGAMGPSIFLKEIGDKNLNQIKQEFKTISNADLDWYNSKQLKNYENNYQSNNINFNVGDVVSHTIFGSGVVIDAKGDILTIAFKAPHGVKSIIKTHKSLKRIKN